MVKWKRSGLGLAALQCITFVAPALGSPAAPPSAEIRISPDVLEDRIYGFWLGQMVGNIYGLPHENVHIEAPGEANFPFGYDALEISYYQYHFGSTRMSGVMRAFGGAFSDDDTDIEYIYLKLMEDVGTTPTYADIRAAWMAHVDNWVWLANRQSLALMHEGYGPPYTGRKDMNADWFQIDPQLVNEIWSVTAPGMINYAAAKSDWAARVMADGNGTGPTIAYGAMFAAAISEPDVGKLVDIGAAALPEDSKFRQVIADMKALHTKYPNDWQAAREAMAEKYFRQQPEPSIWDANLNGACAILALLYGEGDFQRTMDLASAIGFDADNQAATLGGLLGMTHGAASIPHDLLYPVEGWSEPFNDRYLNRSRRDMPNASIRDMARRTAKLAEKVILANGGRIDRDGKLVINPGADFVPPLEVGKQAPRTVVKGEPVDWQLYGGGNQPSWHLAAGELPTGLNLSYSGNITGTPTIPGKYGATVETNEKGKSAKGELSWLVVGNNLAPQADEIVASDPALVGALERLRDGKTLAGDDISTKPGPVQLEQFGYRWNQPVTINAIVVTMGHMDEASGWFTSLSAEYQDKGGNWRAIAGVSSIPGPILDNDKHRHPHYGQYTFSFPEISTKAIRIEGLSGGEADRRNVKLSELSVHGP